MRKKHDNKFDVSWFNLKNYDPFKTMSVDDWILQLKLRADVYRVVEYCSTIHLAEYKVFLSSMADLLRNGVCSDIPEDNVVLLRSKDSELVYPFSTPSINSLTNLQFREMEEDPYYREIWDACDHELNYYCNPDHFDELPQKAHEPYDFTFDHSQWLGSGLAHVTIDVTVTDEQIKSDFAHWLKHYRKAINYVKPKKKLFTQVDFDEWVEYGVVPYLDLMLISKIEGKKITQERLAELIFPDRQDIEETPDRIRKVTKKKAEELIKNKIHIVLEAQVAAKKLLK